MKTSQKVTEAQVLAEVSTTVSAKVQNTVTVPPFPIDVLPKSMAEFAKELHRSNSFPLDFTGAGFLFAASVAIGNTYHVKVKEGYTMPAVLWLAIVGNPGTCKSHPLKLALKPLADRDADAYDRHKIDLMVWENEQAERKKQKPSKAQAAEAEATPPTPRPNWCMHVMTDATMEGLLSKLENLPRGVGMYRDELSGWWGSFDQYRAGADKEKWLTMYNGGQLDWVRKTAGDGLVRNPFVGVIGTTQPDVLGTLGKVQDGFLPRIGFVYPDAQAKPYHTQGQVDCAYFETYKAQVEKLLEIPMPTVNGVFVPNMLPLSERASELFMEWDRTNTDRTNNAETNSIAGIYPKLEMLLHRLALILEVLHSRLDRSTISQSIGPDAMKGALRLVDYFEATALKVHFQLFEADAVDKLDDKKARVYEALPDNFTTKEGHEVASAWAWLQALSKGS